MEVSIKKEIFLANLPCQICRENIINATKRQKGIHSEFDSEQQILNLQYDDQTDYVFLAKEIRNILKDHKHQIRIQESESLFVREYRLENNHWDKLSIEAGIKELSGVKDVSIINHKLHIVSNVSNQKPIIRQIRKLFKGLKISETEEETVSRFDIITLIISFLLFLSALLFNLSTAWEFALFFLAYLLAGYKVIIASIRAILQGRFFEETFLMSIATVGAFFIGEYPEGVAVMLFYCVGEIIQEAALDKSRRSISKLMDLRPDYANLLIDGKTTRVDPENVPIGAMVLVQPGERIPFDGIVLEGTSALDVSALTGEAEFQTIEPGSRVLSGSINTSQVFTIQVDKTYHDSTASKILELVETSASRKAPTEKMITKFSRYYTPVVVIGALILAFVVPLFTDHNFSAWIYRALILLVISCPCALVISIPLGFFGGIGNASRNGILVKGSNYLDALNSLKTIVFDKTGTLTKGSFSIKEIIPASDYTKEEVLSYAILAESHSHHPLARSFTADDLEIPEISSYQEHPGLGIQVQTDKDMVLAGNAQLLRREAIEFSEIEAIGTILYLALNGKYIGAIVLADQVKLEALAALKELKDLGVQETVLLSGDKKESVEAVGRELEIDQVYYQLLPADKVNKLEEIKTKSGKIAYVGDGINDAPVLAMADLGIAMGGLGSDAAIEASDIVIMNDDLSKLPTMIKIAHITRRIVWQNIIFALTVKLLFLVLGALGYAGMWDAVFADVGVSLLAIINALGIMRYESTSTVRF